MFPSFPQLASIVRSKRRHLSKYSTMHSQKTLLESHTRHEPKSDGNKRSADDMKANEIQNSY